MLARNDRRVRGDERVPVHVRAPHGRAAAPRGDARRARRRDEAAALMALTQDADVPRSRPRTRPTASTSGVNIGRAAGAGHPRSRARARAAPVERRHQLHDRGRRGPGAPEPLTTSYEKLQSLAWPGAERSAPYRGRRRADEQTDADDGRRAPRGSRRHRATSGRTCSRHAAPAHPGDDVRRPRRARACGGCAVAATAGCSRAAIFLALVAAYHFACAWPLDRRPDRGAADRVAHRRLRGRAPQRAARVARPARAPGVAHPALQRRRAADDARPRRARRRRRHVHGRVHRAQPRGLVEVRPRRVRRSHRQSSRVTGHGRRSTSRMQRLLRRTVPTRERHGRRRRARSPRRRSSPTRPRRPRR